MLPTFNVLIKAGEIEIWKEFEATDADRAIELAKDSWLDILETVGQQGLMEETEFHIIQFEETT